MAEFSDRTRFVPWMGAQSRVVHMDGQLAAQESVGDLSSSSVGIFTGFGFTNDGVLDEELLLEIVANLLGRHDERDETRWRILTHGPVNRGRNRRDLETAIICGWERIRGGTPAASDPMGGANVRGGLGERFVQDSTALFPQRCTQLVLIL